VATKVIALFNQAGGVGKTTLTMNLGYHLARRNHNVLLIDLDPQGSLTIFMGIEPHDLDYEQTVYGALMDKSTLPTQSLLEMSLAPSNIELSAAESRLVSIVGREKRLKKALSPILKNYDFVLIDCPPTLGILSILGLVASTHVLIPLQTQYKAFKGLELLLETIRDLKDEDINPDLQIAGIVPNLHGRELQHRDILQSVTEQLENVTQILPPIPKAIAFADATMAHQPLAVYDPNHKIIPVLDEVVDHLETL
jgi:chromosome partitioning protein